MKPSWIYSPKDEGFELKGCWKRLLDDGTDGDLCNWHNKKVQVLILRQLCKITVWLGVIAVCQVLTVCMIY
jgi:hypothetical protein